MPWVCYVFGKLAVYQSDRRVEVSFAGGRTGPSVTGGGSATPPDAPPRQSGDVLTGHFSRAAS